MIQTRGTSLRPSGATPASAPAENTNCCWVSARCVIFRTSPTDYRNLRPGKPSAAAWTTISGRLWPPASLILGGEHDQRKDSMLIFEVSDAIVSDSERYPVSLRSVMLR